MCKKTRGSVAAIPGGMTEALSFDPACRLLQKDRPQASTHCIRAWAKRGRIGVFTCSDHSSAEISPMRYRTFLIVCGSLVVLCHPLWFSTAKSVENSRDPDEQLLEGTGIGSDEASLLDYLGKLSGTGSK